MGKKTNKFCFSLILQAIRISSGVGMMHQSLDASHTYASNVEPYAQLRLFQIRPVRLYYFFFSFEGESERITLMLWYAI